MHLHAVDLNLLRLFDAVYRARSVTRAAERLGLTQPAASQGLTRLRTLIHDPLFMRAPGGVKPTPRADRLAPAVAAALSTLELALGEAAGFDPRHSQRTFRIHMSDIGEGRFLPDLMVALREQAPGVRIETLPLPRGEVSDALHGGRIDFAFGFLPMVRDSERVELLRDRYVVLLRAGHPFTRRRRPASGLLAALRELEFVNVRTHGDTLRILQQLQVEDRLRLTTEHFMVLPAIVRATDLAVVMPHNIAEGFAAEGSYAIVEPPLAGREFAVSLHWSRRFQADPGNAWLRELVTGLFRQPA
ncbi:MAG TPA: LysR family transcriptional regulator [Ramlibacter sp.]|jgi:DNA-binding transcriptional LysR family regulator|uniref:LysR family transcriptional regulator n=1 Tax=Ramlibacter sp. TaxID=1917967 RepID=UPI002D2B3108|nr:LysR family transcriptional regulator [Ramlibacter sp.]HZY20029.1 LysR family transcriptional regulator [Ramlibacter sp.]